MSPKYFLYFFPSIMSKWLHFFMGRLSSTIHVALSVGTLEFSDMISITILSQAPRRPLAASCASVENAGPTVRAVLQVVILFSNMSSRFMWYRRNNTFWVIVGFFLAQITVCVGEWSPLEGDLWKCRLSAIWSSISTHVLECGKLQECVTGLYQITKYFINSVLSRGYVEVILWVVFLFFFLVANYSPIAVIYLHLHQFICHIKFV